MNINSFNNTIKTMGSSGINWKIFPPINTNHITRKIVENFKFKNELLGDMFIESERTGQFTDYFETVIKNSCGKTFGRELFSIAPENGDMIGYDIKINPDYRQKNHRFGEILRLFSVMEMIENGSKDLKIVSKDTAVYFHSKYKFVPNFIEFRRRDELLRGIIEDKSPEFKHIAEDAGELLSKAFSKADDKPFQRQLTIQANDIVRRYIELALQKPEPQKNHPLKACFEMILTRENVIRNKEFFNTLFTKHGIDFKIS